VRLNEIYGKYRDQVRFFVIYIREAHPDDGWRVPENLRQNIHFREPCSDGERKAVATLCQINLDLEMPMLVDAIDNRVEDGYIALPMRLYLIGRDGRIVYTGERGPRGFDPDSWEAAIKAEIG
jgi:iodothyronine deiodinase-like protein